MRFLPALIVVLAGCGVQEDLDVPAPPDAEGPLQGPLPVHPEAPTEPTTPAETTDPGTPMDTAAPVDDARFTVWNVPNALDCGEVVTVDVTLENAGTTTWTKADLYKLGFVDDDDPFVAGTRVHLDDTDVVEPGDEVSISWELTAPDVEGVYTTDVQMVLELVH